MTAVADPAALGLLHDSASRAAATYWPGRPVVINTALFAGALGDNSNGRVNLTVHAPVCDGAGDVGERAGNAVLAALSTLAGQIEALRVQLDQLVDHAGGVPAWASGTGRSHGDAAAGPGSMSPNVWSRSERIMSAQDEPAGVVLPLDLVAAASRVMAEHAQPHVVADDVEAQFGRPVVGRLVGQDEIPRVVPGQGLQTGGPLLVREVELVEQAPPHRPLAVSHALIVPDRLPESVRAELGSGEPLDRLLTRHGVDWTAIVQPEEGFVAPVEVVAGEFAWLGEAAGAAVELLRVVSIAGRPVAILIDELPLRSPRAVPA